MNSDFDLDKITDKMNFILDNLDKLKFLRDIPEEKFYNDFRNIESAKYLLQITIESMIDIANHIIARKRMGRPKTYGDSFTLLQDNKIISPEKVKVFKTMVKFRNRVVHLYQEVNPAEIYKILHNNLQDFTGYLEQIRKYITEK
ncbi:MAG: DUF86 domain-containing protein [Firmicutes bacterium]|jgi:uncharacterized protein YutE (UPF0331/DUF86 family)|nr:DUF86 domain-containing protein [Bacillota bacterium]